MASYASSPIPHGRTAPIAIAPALRVRADPWPDIAEAAEPAWERLAAQASEPSPFLEPWGLLPALRALDPQGTARLLRFEHQGELVGLFPVAASRSYYGRPIPHLHGWSHANAFLGAPLVAAGHERAFWTALLEWADRNAGLALFLHLVDLPLAGPLHAALAGVLAEQHRTSGVVHRTNRAMLCSAETPEAYLAGSLSGKKRKELRRQATRLGELGAVTSERRHDAEGLDAWTDAFLALERAGWKGKAGSALASQAETTALFRATLAGAAARGKLERLALRLDGRPIAMLATFLTPPGAFSYKTAFDEDYARFSPGVQLQCENLQILDRPDIAWIDSCAAADHPMIDHIWRERREVGRVSIAIGGRLRRALFDAILGREMRGQDGAS